MLNTDKAEMLKATRFHILKHPRVSYSDLVAELRLPRLTTVQFYNIKAQLKKQGKLPISGEARAISNPLTSIANHTPPTKSQRIEILDTIDVSTFSDEIKDHYKTSILGLLNRLVPAGNNIQMVLLSDPPSLEIRRIVS